jgi:hypothetical protein
MFVSKADSEIFKFGFIENDLGISVYPDVDGFIVKSETFTLG